MSKRERSKCLRIVYLMATTSLWPDGAGCQQYIRKQKIKWSWSGTSRRTDNEAPVTYGQFVYARLIFYLDNEKEVTKKEHDEIVKTAKFGG